MELRTLLDFYCMERQEYNDEMQAASKTNDRIVIITKLCLFAAISTDSMLTNPP